MPCEALAYAALSDCEIWGCDLREIEGLEELATEPAARYAAVGRVRGHAQSQQIKKADLFICL